MEIIRETKQFIQTTDGKPINVGDKVLYTSGGKTYLGVFVGITKRSDLEFEFDDLTDTSFMWAIKPSSIDKIFKVEYKLV